MTFDLQSLKRWFQTEKRDLPWRENPSPYRVWISEVMLQQTQASVVIPYYERWMERFPTVEHLAASKIEDVIKTWEGLGYYSRARNLHEGAKTFKGKIPDTYEELSKIKGLGPYTIGAILSFAFHKKIAAVDGNVLRVISRYFALKEDIAKAKTASFIRNIVEQFLPEEESWIINEALIELGAVLCQKKAKCSACPLRTSCQAYIQGITDELPIKTKGPVTTPLYRTVAILKHQGSVLLKKGEKGKIMEDLYEFPYFETNVEGLEKKQLIDLIQKELGLETEVVESLSRVKHTFTRFRVELTPALCSVSTKNYSEGYSWHDIEEIKDLPFSSGHRKIASDLLHIV